MTGVAIFARHGDKTPSPVGGENIRIGNHPSIRRFDRYVLIDVIDDIFEIVSQAASDKRTLFILTVTNASNVLREYESIAPPNLKSAEAVTGIAESDSISHEDLLQRMVALHGDAFLFAGGFGAWQSNRYQKIVERTLRTKSPLDEWFYHVPYGVNTIHRVAMDKSPDQSVVGLDFNTMFPSCFKENNYPHPGRLKHSREGYKLLTLCMTNEIAGAFRCVISQPDKFMQSYHMFAVGYGGLSLHTELPHQFQTLLHANEIQFWSNHANIEILEGVYSYHLIQHPLTGLANKIFQRRLDGDPVAKKLAKQELVLMHASTARSLKTRADLTSMREQYGFSFDFLESLDTDTIELPLIECKANVYCLQRQVLANARIKLLRLIEHNCVYFPQAKLCYANVDSLHYTMPSVTKEAFLGAQDIGKAMGQLKVEFEGDAGLWLDPGRWWIANKGEIIAHRSGAHYQTPNFRNMSLHHHFVKSDNHLVQVQPITFNSDPDALSVTLAELVRENVEWVKKLWGQFRA